ncbi:MAG: NAD-glutamate dehydrogenase [Beijerinckiaceae bacterium]|jgi:glutamate dehydrogenase|nr:NAD-glutamate dehydrogenase [Beijerinckiaceae bacterium]
MSSASKPAASTPGALPASKDVAALVFARVDAEDLAPLSEAFRESLAASTLAFLAHREVGHASIRIEPLDLPGGGGTLIEIVNDDMPFLLDSTLADLTERGYPLALVAHPILAVERRPDGRLARLIGPSSGRELAPVQRESLLHIHLGIALDAAERQALAESLSTIFVEIRAAVTDWIPMRTRIAEIATRYRATPPLLPADEIAEAVQFLDWLLAENFTLLGVREYRFSDPDISSDPVPAEGLGILRDPQVKVLRRGRELVVMTPEIRTFLKEPTPLFVAKANVKSRIHRRVYLDYVGVKILNARGELEGELRVVGLFTSTAYTGSARTIPYLRHKVARVIERAGFDHASHSGKALINVLESYPRDELFQVDLDTLFRFALDVLALSERPRLRALARVDRFDRFVSVMVYVPKDRYDTQVRLRIGDFLARSYEGRVSAAYPAYPEGPLSRTHYIIGRSEGKTPVIDRETLEAGILAIVRTWADDFRNALAREAPEGKAGGWGRIWTGAFNAAYREAFTASEAIADIGMLERLSASLPFAFNFLRRGGEPDSRANLKVFSHGSPIPLSRRVPILENLGFTVINERTYRIVPEGGETHWLHDMTLERARGGAIDLARLEANLEATLFGIFAGTLESDRYNVLVTEAGLSPREADILRSYARYLRQIGVPYGQIYIADALGRYPAATQSLARLFALRFDPDLREKPGDRSRLVEAMQSALLSEVDKITSLDDDRIFRRMLNLIQATLRTNAYQEGRPTIAFKFACDQIENLPLPRPLYEIFVASPQVEGLHLRFGKVARGGLRWSDRPMDFRTEILGLVKAQQVKNAVIVPVGAKGGFVPKNLPPASDRDAWFAEGTASYKTFVSALLDLTDTIRGDTIVPPARTLRYDGDDPYLVVAADKGTATFSDTANAISEARGHWLSDAFASGGSAGYDHKKMGITARGGWEAVKRHFREIDIDIQTMPFTVAGVGDMSGDVFGNGMLLSPQIRLVAAFDHRDIFIDPDPDAAKGFAERQRLFDKPRSSWQDYDPKLISKGGGVFSRSLKKIPLTPEIRALLGLEGIDATPQAVMTAILKARVDLLWFGGIGTYIRASSESDADAGDRANDAIRISAADLGARVIGEGANLGMTQLGRIEAARRGVRINTDAIDNSAGVNSSDVEVNLKIALSKPEADGRLDRAARNTLLASMTDEVGRLVLRNNYLQSLALSLTQRLGAAANAELIDLMRALEAEGRLDRKVEFLPSDAEIAARSGRNEGLTRPELAVLLAYAKLALYDHLLASNVPDDTYLVEEARRYFPRDVQERFADAIESHRLRREIVATQLSNAVINRGGPAIVTRLAARTGRPVPDIARAYALARDVFGILEVNLAIDALDTKIGGAVQLGLYAAAQQHATERMLWFLRNVDFTPGLSTLVTRFRKGVVEVEKKRDALLSDPAKALREAALAARIADGVPAALAGRIVDIPISAAALDATLIAERTGVDVVSAARTIFSLADRLDLTGMRSGAQAVQTTDPYERLALDRALSAIEEASRKIAVEAIVRHGPGEKGVALWASAKGELLERTLATIQGLVTGPLNQAKLTVLGGLLGDLVRE